MPDRTDYTPAIRARLNQIRERHAAYTASHNHPGAFACCSAHGAADDVPVLLDAVEAMLRICPSRHEAPGIKSECSWCAGEAHTIDKIWDLLAGNLLDPPDVQDSGEAAATEMHPPAAEDTTGATP